MEHLDLVALLVTTGLLSWIPVHSLECPEEIFIFEHETLQVNCTGNESPGDVTCSVSEDISAELEVKRLRETIQISAKNVSFTDQGNTGSLTCNPDEVWIDGHLSRRPLPIDGPDCLIMNWTTLSCSWAPNATYQMKHVSLDQEEVVHMETMAYWNQSDGKSGHFDFTDSNQNNFTLNSSTFAFGEILSVSVQVKIKLTESSGYDFGDLFKGGNFNTSLIVKPGPVRHLACSPGSRNATCSWVLPSDRHALTVDVKLTPVNLTWTNTSILQQFIEDLKPNTNYTVQVYSVPLQGGFQSEVQHFRFKTKPDVPGDHPLTTPGSFWVHSCSEEHCKVTVYFQPLKNDILHSDHHDVNYNISLKGQPGCENQNATVQHGESSIDFRINKTCDYNLTLVAFNDLGESPAPQSVLRLPRDDERLRAPPVIVRRRSDNTAVLQWKAGCHSDRDYTVFWCQKEKTMCSCHGPVQWKGVGNKCNMTFPLKTRRVDETLFAISAQVDNKSSGLNWTAQYDYDDTQKPDRPVLHGEVIQDSQSLRIKWQPQKCAARKCKAYITSYNIMYCKTVKCTGSLECSGEGKYSSAALENEIMISVSTGTYSVTLEALSYAGSVQSEVICLMVKEKWYKRWWFALVVAAVLAIFVVAVGARTCTGVCKKAYKWFQEGVRINMPQRQASIHGQGESSGSSLLHYSRNETAV